MPLNTCDVLLVIPAYREAARLPPFLRALHAAFLTASYRVELLVVDDGSPLPDWIALQTALAPLAGDPPSNARGLHLRPLLRLDGNTRKGGAILAGWLAGDQAARWLAFVDADGAVPATEVRRLFDEALHEAEQSPGDEGRAMFASRLGAPNGAVRRRLDRRIAGRVFATLARWIVGVKQHDPQCGFKIVSAAAFNRIKTGLEPHGFLFDLALARRLAAAGVPVREVPIMWCEQPGGHLSPWREAISFLAGLRSVRRDPRPGVQQTRLAESRQNPLK